MPQKKLTKRYEYEIKTREGLCVSWRTLYFLNMSDAIDKTLDKFYEDWNSVPDLIELTQKHTVKIS